MTPIAMPAFAPLERPGDGGGGEGDGDGEVDEVGDGDGNEEEDEDDTTALPTNFSGNSTTPILFVQHDLSFPQHHRLLVGESSHGVICVYPLLPRVSLHSSRQSGSEISLLVQKLSQYVVSFFPFVILLP